MSIIKTSTCHFLTKSQEIKLLTFLAINLMKKSGTNNTIMESREQGIQGTTAIGNQKNRWNQGNHQNNGNHGNQVNQGTKQPRKQKTMVQRNMDSRNCKQPSNQRTGNRRSAKFFVCPLSDFCPLPWP